MERFSTSLLGQADTLLLATDGSPFSDGAIQEAIFFGQACRTRVVVLHVVQLEAESIKAAHSLVMQRQKEMDPHLDQIRRMARDSGVEIEVVVVGGGSTAKTIVEQARLRKADAILMGRHGKAGRLSQLVGTMTARVIGLGFPRVLVVPKDFLIGGAHIILALNDSASSQLAAREALSLGGTCKTLETFTVVSVARSENEYPRALEMVEEFCHNWRREGSKAICDPLALLGNPAEVIVRAAREREADMILMGGRGKNFMAKMLMGSVTESVIGRANCAVLVLTAPD